MSRTGELDTDLDQLLWELKLLQPTEMRSGSLPTAQITLDGALAKACRSLQIVLQTLTKLIWISSRVEWT